MKQSADGAAQPEQFLRAGAVAGHDMLETIEVPPSLLLSERLATELGLITRRT